MIQQFTASPVIPVLTFQEIDIALAVCEKLLENNLNNLEITLRTDAALHCVEAIAKAFPEAYIGAGTITTIEQLTNCQNAGAQFAVSPGFTAHLVQHAKRIKMPYLPGVSTPAEVMQLSELDVQIQKFFHAHYASGIKMLSIFNSLFPQIKFCPTGGIGANDFETFLSLPNVLCLGGSWMVGADMGLDEIASAAKAIANKIHATN